MGLSPYLVSPQLPGVPNPSCCLWRVINHSVRAMHWEQGNKMAFHAIILCNKAPGGRKMMNNVFCVSQLLPKIKHSSPPSAAPLRHKCGCCHTTPEPRPPREHVLLQLSAQPRRPARICRMQLGGPETSVQFWLLWGVGCEPPKGSAPQAPASRMALGKGGWKAAPTCTPC